MAEEGGSERAEPSTLDRREVPQRWGCSEMGWEALREWGSWGGGLPSLLPVPSLLSRTPGSRDAAEQMTGSEGVTGHSGKKMPPRVARQDSNHSSWWRFPRLLDEPVQKRWPIASLHTRRRSTTKGPGRQTHWRAGAELRL